MDTKMFFCVKVSHSGNKTRASTTFSTTLTAHHPPSKRGPDITEREFHYLQYKILSQFKRGFNSSHDAEPVIL